MEEKEMDRCPYCQSDNLDYLEMDEDMTFDGEFVIIREIHCFDCNNIFKQREYYNYIRCEQTDLYGGSLGKK